MLLYAAQGLQVTADLKDIDTLIRLSGRMECESPNRHLYEFVGNIRLDRHRLACSQRVFLLMKGYFLYIVLILKLLPSFGSSFSIKRTRTMR